MPAFFNSVGNSDWFHSITEYNSTLSGGTNQVIGSASSLGETTISPATANDGKTITDAEEQNELIADFESGALPTPSVDSQGYADTVYALFMPNSKTLDGPDGAGTGGVQWCAYHNTLAYDGLDVPYMVLPAFVAGSNYAEGCGDNPTLFEDFTSAASHELIESVTDPAIGLDTADAYAYPAAWGDNNNDVGEVADACDTGSASDSESVNGYYVQALWSSATKSCEFSRTFVNLTPGYASVPAGTGQTYAATTDGGTSVTSSTTLSISPSGGATGASCTGDVCSATQPGTYTVTGSSGGTGADASPVGTYPVSCSGAADSKYVISYVAGTLSITRAGLTVTGPSPTVEYGSGLPALAAQIGGFVNGDSASSLTTQPTCGTTATSTSGAGSYPVTCSGASDPNYSVTYVPGSLTITTAPLTVSAPSPTIQYGQALPSLTPSIGGFQGSDSASSLTTLPTCTTTATASSGAGTYPVTCSGASDPNYAVTYVSGVLTITTAPLSVVAPSPYIRDRTPIPVLTPTYSGLQGGDTAASLTTPATCVTTAKTMSVPGAYPVTCSGASDPNYAISYVNGTITLVKRPVVTSVSPSAGPRLGGTIVTITGSYLSGATAVTFGTVPAESFTIVSSTEITAVSPEVSAAGVKGIVVTTLGGGASAAVAGDKFTFERPTVSGLSPSTGPTAGGTSVTITGIDFSAATEVEFGSATAKFTVVSDTQIIATSPKHSAGSVVVSVTSPDGKSPSMYAKKFTYST